MSQIEKESKKEGLPELPCPIEGFDILLSERHPLRYHLHELIEHLRRHRDLTITEEQRETIEGYMQGWTKGGSLKYKLPTYDAARRFIAEQEGEFERARAEYEERLSGPKDRDGWSRIVHERDERLRDLDVDRHIIALFCLDRDNNLVVDCLVAVSPRATRLHIPTTRESYFIDPSRKKGLEIVRYESPVKFAEENDLRIIDSITDTAYGRTISMSANYRMLRTRK